MKTQRFEVSIHVPDFLLFTPAHCPSADSSPTDGRKKKMIIVFFRNNEIIEKYKGVCLTLPPHRIRRRSSCHVILTPTRYVSVAMMMIIIAVNNNIGTQGRVSPSPTTTKSRKIIFWLSTDWLAASPNGMMMIFRSARLRFMKLPFVLLLLLLLLFGSTSLSLSLFYRENNAPFAMEEKTPGMART